MRVIFLEMRVVFVSLWCGWLGSQEFAKQYPDEALISSGAASFLLPPVVPSLQIQLVPGDPLMPGQPLEVTFRLQAPGSVPLPVEGLPTPPTRMPTPGESGGPRVDFNLRPTLPGWLRLYVQFSVDDAVRLAEFALPVVVR